MTENFNLPEQVVLLANGLFPKHDIPLHMIDNASSIICCDGAVTNLINYGKRPHAIVGDFDSIPANLKKDLSQLLIHTPDQSENDLRKALQWIEQQGSTEVIILGATGNREDHSLGNVFSLLQFPTQMQLTLVTDFGVFSLCNGSGEYISHMGQPVSIFSLDPQLEINSTNLKYNLNSYRLNTLYSGTLNESESESFTIQCDGGRVLVYQGHHA